MSGGLGWADVTTLSCSYQNTPENQDSEPTQSSYTFRDENSEPIRPYPENASYYRSEAEVEVKEVTGSSSESDNLPHHAIQTFLQSRLEVFAESSPGLLQTTALDPEPEPSSGPEAVNDISLATNSPVPKRSRSLAFGFFNFLRKVAILGVKLTIIAGGFYGASLMWKEYQVDRRNQLELREKMRQLELSHASLLNKYIEVSEQLGAERDARAAVEASFEMEHRALQRQIRYAKAEVNQLGGKVRKLTSSQPKVRVPINLAASIEEGSREGEADE